MTARLPWAKMFTFARDKLGYSEPQFWKLTLRKFIALRDAFYDANTPPKEREVFADELF